MSKTQPLQGRKEIGARDAQMTRQDRFALRMEQAAIHILENVLRRRRWSANDKDAIAAHLALLVRREIKDARIAAPEI